MGKSGDARVELVSDCLSEALVAGRVCQATESTASHRAPDTIQSSWFDRMTGCILGDGVSAAAVRTRERERAEMSESGCAVCMSAGSEA